MLSLRSIFNCGGDVRDGLYVGHILFSNVMYVLEPYDLPLTCWGSAETTGDTQAVGTPVRSRRRPRPIRESVRSLSGTNEPFRDTLDSPEPPGLTIGYVLPPDRLSREIHLLRGMQHGQQHLVGHTQLGLPPWGLHMPATQELYSDPHA